MRHQIVTIVLFLSMLPALWAYTYNKGVEGPLSVVIEEPGVMEQLDTPLPLKTTFKNISEEPLKVKLTYTSIETIVFQGSDQAEPDKLIREIEVPAKGNASLDIHVLGTPGTLSTHYPVHLAAQFESAGKEYLLRVVQPFESKIIPNPNWPDANPLQGKLVEKPNELPLNRVPADGGLALAKLTNYRVLWNRDSEKGKWHLLPVGWTGSDKDSAAGFHRESINRGSYRDALQMHPTYRGGAGNTAVEYRIKLPKTTPISISYYCAIRDTAPTEPPSDGVTFRVVAIDSGLEKTVVSKHSASKTWDYAEGDLSAYAGKEIVLRLESDPGPKRNTTCDSCYWGDVTLFAGKKPIFADAEKSMIQQKALHQACIDALKTGKPVQQESYVFELAGGARAAVVFGENGFVDGKISVGTPENFVIYDGIRVAVKDAPLAAWPTTLSAGPLIPKQADTTSGPPKPQRKNPGPAEMSGVREWAQEIEIGGEKATLFYSLLQHGPALQLSVDCSEPAWITLVQLGAASKEIERTYYGHGYVLVKPEKFTVNAGGHAMSTSHVGIDYAGGLSVLMATTTPPTAFTVDAARRIGTLMVRPGTKLTLLPGSKGMFDCAIRYRAINHLKAAAGVKTKLGRLCFDIWGGDYKRHTEIIDNAVRYGVTDSLFVVHNWQRYGYDNRLPDIWPPNPRYGTLADMQETLAKCDAAGILYGLHDNYIDFYPDADDYSLDILSFERHGQPRKAWINLGINARSYQFRPDRLQPFLVRNLDMMLPHLPQSCYFVDVFASAQPNDFYDREGKLHSRTETLECWNRCFDTIRERLTVVSRPRQNEAIRAGFHAPTISESGDDFLAGHLDGADCQFMYVSRTEGGEFRTVIKCEDLERVPWFDAVNHTTFSLHGVGYSSRYETNRGRALHGIESDDYLSCEMLTGHAAMVDLGSAMRGAVRKNWLMQPTLREIAECELIDFEYVDGDIHRQRIVWGSKDGKRVTTIFVNRGTNDWEPKAGYVVPRYGFLAEGPAGIAGIVRKDDRVVELSATKKNGKTRMFVNARRQSVSGLVPIRPMLKSFKYDGDKAFACEVEWDAQTGTKGDYAMFLHCLEPRLGRTQAMNRKGAYFGGGEMPKPTSQWSGKVVTKMGQKKNASGEWLTTIPDDLPAGKYHLLVGLYNSKGDGNRLSLLGHDIDGRRFSLGLMTLKRDKDGKVTELSIDTSKLSDEVEDALMDRIAPPKHAVDFGRFKTTGGFLYETAPDGKKLLITPLPGEPVIEVALKFEADAVTVSAVDADDRTLRDVPVLQQEGRFAFMTREGEFRYIVSPK